MSYGTVPQHLTCMNLNPPDWNSLFQNPVKVRTSVPSGHLVWDKDRNCYFPVVDETFKAVWEATSTLSKHVTVACSATMTVCAPIVLYDQDPFKRSMDVLEFRDVDEEDDTYQWADVRVHLPVQ